MRLAWLLIATSLVAACSGSDVSRSLGARCDTAADCDDRCLEPGTDYPGGFCTLTCDSDDDCADSAHCVSDQGGVCLIACDADPACAYLGSGWACQASSAKAGSGPVMVCAGS